MREDEQQSSDDQSTPDEPISQANGAASEASAATQVKLDQNGTNSNHAPAFVSSTSGDEEIISSNAPGSSVTAEDPASIRSPAVKPSLRREERKRYVLLDSNSSSSISDR